MASLCHICRQQLFRHARRSTIATFRHDRSTRYISSTEKRSDTRIESRQLGDFYNDLLSSPLPKISQTSKTDLPDWVASGGRSEIEERASKLFGSIEGSGYISSNRNAPTSTWQTVNGVPIPPKPIEPDNCCMSGCVNCVWDDYREDVEQWASRLQKAQARSHTTTTSPSPKTNLPRPEVVESSSSMDDDGGGSEGLWQSPSPTNIGSGGGRDVDAAKLFDEIPVGIREFMASEKRIRERKARRKAAKMAG